MIGSHWGMADKLIAMDRRFARKRRMSANNHAKGWGFHNAKVTEGEIDAELTQNLREPLVVDTSKYSCYGLPMEKSQ